ncbi:MAG: 3-hydroxyacyl-CoA dehydrogenase NAD-binding domain-containing protein [Candidatus Thorarchaeota archaeon]|jgi:3-hydroxyacyl-CoA dehydrogenase
MNVKKIAVIGAGLMGSGISYVSAWSSYDVTMVDVSDEALEGGMERLRSYVESGIKRGKLSDSEAKDLLTRVKTTTSLDEAVSDVDLVIEAIYENMDVKKDLFSRMDGAANARTILASNTSSLSISELGKSTARPTKVIGMHYFSPVPAMKLLEIIVGEQTDEDTIDTAIAVGQSQGKTTVKAKDSPGFIVNRLGAQILRNSVLVIEQGIATAEEIDSAMKEHFKVPMGPLELTDFVGIDVSFNTMTTLYRELGNCFSPPATLSNLVESGTIGRKTGSGFYEYGDQQSSTENPKGADSAIIALRIIAPYLREAMIEVETGIATEEDIDNAMKLGRNFKEGPFETIERLGRKKVREELRKLQNQFGDCYSLPKMLQ